MKLNKNKIKNVIIETIMFMSIKLETINLFMIKKEKNIDKVQIKKLKNSLIKPLFKPIIEVINSKIRMIQSTKLRFKNSIIDWLEIV